MGDPRQAYEELLQRLQAFTDRVLARFEDQIRCGPGCADCCQRDLNLFPFEAARLVEAAQALPGPIRSQVLERAADCAVHDDAACPLLEADRCLVYDARSVICRTHGLPCLFDDGSGRAELSLCPHNLQAVERVDGQVVLDLDPVNQVLATINHLECSRCGTSPERMPVSRALLDGLDDDGGGS